MMVLPLPILHKDDPLLAQPSRPVVWPDAELPQELARLHATLADFRRRHGFGRAMSAVQAGIAKRVIVMNLGAAPFALINPQLTWRSNETFEVWDDCLSLPDCVVRVHRQRSISLRYEDERGRTRHWQRLPPDMAELLQHELDHQGGVLMDARAEGPDAIRPIAEHAALVANSRPREHRLSLAQIRRSSEVIAAEFLHSPQYHCEPMSDALGCNIMLKLETANPIRSFKGRGASFLLHELERKQDHRALVCASAGNWGQAMAQSWRERRIVETERADTLADGIAVRVPIAEAVQDMQGIVDDVLLVGDEHLREAMRLAYAHAGLLLEPAGAAGLAALVAHRVQFAGQHVAVALCGSNLTPSQTQEFFHAP